MSIKIYDGYRLAADTDIWAFQTRLRAVMNPVRDHLDAAWLMNHAVKAIDRADLAGEPRPDMPLMEAMSAFDDGQHKESDQGYFRAAASRAFDPHRFEVSFGYDEPTGRILARLYTDQPEFRTAWEAMSEVEPYGYWNNTDPDEDCTPAEWDEWAAAWDRMDPNGRPPVESMLSFALRSNQVDTGMLCFAMADRGPERTVLLHAAAPSKRDRASGVAMSRLLDTWLERWKRTHGAAPDPSMIIDAFQRLRRSDHASVTAAAEHALADDVVDYAVTPRRDGEPFTRPVAPDASAALATAVTHHLDRLLATAEE